MRKTKITLQVARSATTFLICASLLLPGSLVRAQNPASSPVPKPATGEPAAPPRPGKSLVPALAKDVTIPRESLWWLHEGNRAIRVGDWKLVAAKDDAWELYDLKSDRAEQHNLAAEMPEKVKELEQMWQRQTDSFVELAKKTLDEQPAGRAKRAARTKRDAK